MGINMIIHTHKTSLKTIWRIASIGTTTSILWRIFHQVLFFRAASTGAGTLSPNSFRSSFCSPTVFPFYHSMLTYSISLLSSHCFPNMIPTKPYKTRHHGWYGGFLEWGTPKWSMVFYLLFHFKPSILGYPHDLGNLHIRRVPSGKRLHRYWKWPVEIVDLPINSMVDLSSSFFVCWPGRVTSPVINPIIWKTPH